MAASLCMKRLTKERERFPSDSGEFWVNWKDSNLRHFNAYIVGPEDSVYYCKLIKLRFDIPDTYPIIPPKVTFIQHTGDRLHPNLYTEGKVCLSILGTWSGPGWAQNVNVEAVLRTVRSLLDQKPYMHEPGQADRPDFNAYVRHQGWRWLLLDYLERETDADAKIWLEGHLRKNGKGMIAELERQKEQARSGQTMSSPYAGGRQTVMDFERLLTELKDRIPSAPGPVEDRLPPGQVMEDAKAKRRFPFETESRSTDGPPPAKKQNVVVNLE